MNSLHGDLIVAERSNRVTYCTAECSIRVTALLEYLDCALVTASVTQWILIWFLVNH